MLDRLIWLDYAILAIIGLSMLLGLWRGFMREVLSLGAWVAAFVVALTFADTAAAYLIDYVTVASVRSILAFGGLFLITLFAGGLINLLVAQIMQSTGLSGTDRLIGLIFGLLRGVAFVAVLVLLAGLTPLPEEPEWSRSVLLPYFQTLALWLRQFLPPGLAEQFTFR